jgi:hypothetical protein
MRCMPAPIPSLPLWRRLPPFAWALIAGVLSLVAAFLPTAWHMLADRPGPPTAQAKEPWRIDVGSDGTVRVMGLQPGTDTLGSLQGRLGEALQPAIVARRGEAGALEALVDPFSAGFVSGRLVLAFDAPADALARWRENAAKSGVMDTGAHRYSLSADSAREAASVRLVGATFVPALSLSADDVMQRFGAPATVQAGGEGLQTWLYPDRGLAIALQPGRKAVLQYVAPPDFERRLRPAMSPAASDRTPARTAPPTTR